MKIEATKMTRGEIYVTARDFLIPEAERLTNEALGAHYGAKPGLFFNIDHYKIEWSRRFLATMNALWKKNGARLESEVRARLADNRYLAEQIAKQKARKRGLPA